jgi:hypothetical protein
MSLASVFEIIVVEVRFELRESQLLLKIVEGVLVCVCEFARILVSR